MNDYFPRAGHNSGRTRMGSVLLLLLTGIFVCPNQTMLASTRQWTGDDSGLWSDPDNWFPVGVPQNGDSLTFPAVGPLDATSMVNDLTGLTVDNMTFTAGGYALNGNTLTIQGITDNHTSGGLNIVRCNIQFSGVRGRLNSLGTGLLEINGTTTLVNNQELIITPVISNITVSGAIVGSGSLVKRDDGALYLRGSANNTYSGATRVEGGELHLAKTGAARAISADVTIDARFIGNAALFDDLPGQYPPALSMLLTNGGDWFITNGATVTNLFLHNGALGGTGLLNLECDVTTEGFCPVACSLNLGQQTRTFFVNRDSILREEVFIDGHIIGPLGPNSSGLIKDGLGTLTLDAQNSYAGPTSVRRGELRVEHAGALGSTGAGGETRLQGGDLYLDGGTFTCPEAIVVEAPFSAVLFSGNVTLTGPVSLGDSGSFRGIGVDSSSRLEIASVISGPGRLHVSGGIVRLSGAAPNTFTGGVNVSAPGGHSADIALELAKPDNAVAIPNDVALSASFTNTCVLRSFQKGGVREVHLGQHSSWLMNGHVAAPSLLTFRAADAFVDTGGGQLQFSDGAMIEHRFGGGPPARILGRVAFLGQTNELFLAANSLLHLTGPVTGGATIRQRSLSDDGPGGTLFLTSDNQFTGPFMVDDGILQVGSSDALGSTTAGTFVNHNASLALAGGIAVGFEPLTLDTTNAGAITSLGAVTNIWRGDISLQSTASLNVPDAGGVLRLESFIGCCPSSITGPGGLTKSGPGTAIITGTVANNYTGVTTINDGALEASRTQGPALSGNVIVSGANAILRTGRTPAPQALPVAARVTVQDGALWTMNSATAENLSSLLGDGRIEIGAGAALTLSNSVSCTFSGQLGGTGALNKYDLASFRVTGNSPGYTGPATVFDGTYKVDGQFLNSPVTVKASSILRGTGAAGDIVVENGGVVQADSDGPGRLGGQFVVNSANFQSGGVLGLALYGPHPTGGNDSLFVNNAVTLANSRLSSGFQYAPRDGDVITLINKNSAGPVSGALSGFPEGVLRLIGGVPVVMSYVGGDGNDVTLTVTNLPLQEGGAQLVSGNGGGALVPDDCSRLTLIVTNRGAVVLTELRAQLRSLTEGVTVTKAESDYPNLVPNARGSNATPFQIRTDPSFPCGAGVEFELVLTASNQPPFAIIYTLLGTSGYGLDFDGRNDQVEIPANTFAGVVNNFTIELWAKPTSNRSESGETNSGVSGISVPLRQLQRFAVFPDRGNLAYGATHVSAGLSIGRNGISVYEQGTNTALGALHLPSRLVYSNAVAGWTHVALVYANRAPRLYVNGTLVRSGAATPFPNVHPSSSLGGSPQASYGNFDGQLDEVRIWNTALNQSQIQSNMMRSLTGTEPGLITYFRCDDANGDNLVDSAPAAPNRDGTLANGAAFGLPGVTPFGDVNCNAGGGACESCFVVSGRFDTNALESARRITATGLPSICDPPKPCPGFDELPDAPVRHVLHHFTNSTAAELCVTAQLRFDCPGTSPGDIGVAAYLGDFRINQPCSSFLGDDGAFGPPSPPFSFRVPPLTNFVLVVTARETNIPCDAYALELFGLPCLPPTLSIARDDVSDKVLLQWSSAYPEFRLQSANFFNSPGPTGFGNVPTPPVLSGAKFIVTNSAVAAQQFFRLRR